MMIFEIMKDLRSRCTAACMAGLLVLTGCANFQVTVPDSDPIRTKGQVAEYQKKTMHAFFWGLLLDPQVLAAECHGQGINDVVIHHTLAHDLVGDLDAAGIPFTLHWGKYSAFLTPERVRNRYGASVDQWLTSRSTLLQSPAVRRIFNNRFTSASGLEN